MDKGGLEVELWKQPSWVTLVSLPEDGWSTPAMASLVA
jgi:hypothetical protein